MDKQSPHETTKRLALELPFVELCWPFGPEFDVFKIGGKIFMLSSERHCCKVSDEAAFCLIQRPYISKTLLTRRISPRALLQIVGGDKLIIPFC